MSINFRVTSDEPHAAIAPAPVSVRHMVAFRHFARDHGILIDDLADDDAINRSFSFEVSVCRFALAKLAPIFAYDLGAIAVLDEAQFSQRRVRFYKADETGEIMLAVSSAIDGSVDLDLDLAIGNAIAVLKALDLDLDSTGDLPLTVLRERLADATIRTNFVAQRVEHYLPRLDRLAALTAHEQDPHLVWD